MTLWLSLDGYKHFKFVWIVLGNASCKWYKDLSYGWKLDCQNKQISSIQDIPELVDRL